MKIIIVILLICFVLIAGMVFYFINKEHSTNKVYQGPVRPTDDEAYFRKTGITKPLELS